MARIELIDIAHAYGQSWALKQMTLSWSDGGAANHSMTGIESTGTRSGSGSIAPLPIISGT